MGSNHLEDLDRNFVEIYEAARAKVLEQQKQKALIVIDDDVLLLYRGGLPVETFSGLRPPLYVKMKTLGHMPLAVYCLLHEGAGKPLSSTARFSIAGYRASVEAAAGALDTQLEVEQGLLPEPSRIRAKVLGILTRALNNGRIRTTSSRHSPATCTPTSSPCSRLPLASSSMSAARTLPRFAKAGCRRISGTSFAF